MRSQDMWIVKPLSFPNGDSYFEDFNDLRFANSGLITEVNPFFFINESCQLLANSVNLFKQGYFDCAFYSIREALELTISGLYLFSNPEKMKAWRNLEKGFELRTMIPTLKEETTEFAQIKDVFSDFFSKIEQEKKLMNKYVHKQGYKSLYYHYSSFNAHNRPERIKALTIDFETMLRDAITAVALYRLAIDPYPILMLDEDIVQRTPDLIAESFSMSFIKKYIPKDYIERYKNTDLYKGVYKYFASLPRQNDAVYALLHWQYFERKDFDEVLKQKDLLSIYDKIAISLFMVSKKIGKVQIDECLDYNCESKLKDTGMRVGRSYYEEVFKGELDWSVPHLGDYISRCKLNDFWTYIFHIQPLEREEIENIFAMCEVFNNDVALINKAFNDIIEQHARRSQSTDFSQ